MNYFILRLVRHMQWHNFDLKSGGDQIRIERPGSRRRRRREGWRMGRGYPPPQPTRGSGASWAPPAGSGAERGKSFQRFLSMFGGLLLHICVQLEIIYQQKKKLFFGRL